MSCATCSRTTRGWFGGCLAATVVIELFFLFILGLVGVNRFTVLSLWDFFIAIVIGVPLILGFVCVLSAIPSIAAIWLSERFCIRSLAFFGLAGGLVGAASQAMMFGRFNGLSWLFVVAGCFAGLNYWYVAGKYAGAGRVT
ncbi:hypothetical protein JQ625_23110 [Bradyrhizobium diazoefficiens]|nr:hypothetical protein [Bradyrhizobium diazoefficiens]MBR0777735.1 hypothetical protein [Bradyrhizobium diazoefficiens]